MPKLPKTENITISLILGFQNLISEKEMIKYLFNGRYGMNIKWSRSLCWSLTEAVGGGMWSSAGRIFIIVNIVTWSQPVHHALKLPFLWHIFCNWDMNLINGHPNTRQEIDSWVYFVEYIYLLKNFPHKPLCMVSLPPPCCL